METKSPAFSLNAIDWQKIRTGALVALSGAALTYIPLFAGFSYVANMGTHTIDFTPFVVFALSVVSNVLRKFVSDNQQS